MLQIDFHRAATVFVGQGRTKLWAEPLWPVIPIDSALVLQCQFALRSNSGLEVA